MQSSRQGANIFICNRLCYRGVQNLPAPGGSESAILAQRFLDLWSDECFAPQKCENCGWVLPDFSGQEIVTSLHSVEIRGTENWNGSGNSTTLVEPATKNGGVVGIA